MNRRSFLGRLFALPFAAVAAKAAAKDAQPERPAFVNSPVDAGTIGYLDTTGVISGSPAHTWSTADGSYTISNFTDQDWTIRYEPKTFAVATPTIWKDGWST